LILEKSTSRSLSPVRINPHKTVVKDVLSEDVEEVVVADEVEEEEAEVEALPQVTTTTTTKVLTTTTTKVLTTTITTTNNKVVLLTTKVEMVVLEEEDSPEEIEDSEEEEEVLVEMPELKEIPTTNPDQTKEDKDHEKVNLDPTKVVKVVPQEDDELPDES